MTLFQINAANSCAKMLPDGRIADEAAACDVPIKVTMDCAAGSYPIWDSTGTALTCSAPLKGSPTRQVVEDGRTDTGLLWLMFFCCVMAVICKACAR